MQLKKGWLARQMEAVNREVGAWPPWMQREAGFREYPASEPEKSQVTPTLWDQVVDDMKARDAFGWRKYGRHLMPDDGRDTLQDAYEEALDLAVYLKKAIVERNGRKS